MKFRVKHLNQGTLYLVSQKPYIYPEVLNLTLFGNESYKIMIRMFCWEIFIKTQSYMMKTSLLFSSSNSSYSPNMVCDNYAFLLFYFLIKKIQVQVMLPICEWI